MLMTPFLDWICMACFGRLEENPKILLKFLLKMFVRANEPESCLWPVLGQKVLEFTPGLAPSFPVTPGGSVPARVAAGCTP